ncbi:ABC transporter substrate-binding protein [Dermatobacter hominis]|uniref:ABC transporter substrate-binding protein n=1 Tax=Dermatobacter hominis TaxID=2884263 RepID=UPI001D111E1A|nr:ABC transporter substrate-binding protein [Dermatobacter hominis]UDY37214.1 ABC transporter substrate-binding protein [Dermatobacter hominis]
MDGQFTHGRLRRGRIRIGGLVALFAAIALVAGACGASGGSGEEAEGDGSTTTTAAGGTATSAKWGDMDSPCGEGDLKVKDGEGGTGTDKLYIGVPNDRGAEIRPGLNKEVWDASQSFAAWCNEQGGIGGLQIELVDLDAKLFQVEAAMSKACTSVFALVGGAFTQDNMEFTGKDGSDFHKCKLIDIPAFAVSVEKGLSNGQVQPLPNPPNKKSEQWIMDFKEVYPEESKKNIVVAGELPSLKSVHMQYDAAVQEVGGIEQLDPLSYPVTGMADWTPLAQKVIDSGAGSLYWIGEPSNAANLMAKLKEQGWEGIALNETNVYDANYFSAGPQAVEGSVVRLAFHPFEEADKWPAIKQYQDSLKKYVPDGKEAALGLQSTSAWLLFATAVKACGEKNGGVVDRTCVLQEAAAQKDWTAGGTHAPTDPGGDPPECGMLVVVKDGEFERLYPEIGGKGDDQDGFHCPEGSIATVTEELPAKGAVDPSRPI